MPIVVDHTGVDPSTPMSPQRALTEGRAVIALASLSNVMLKLTGVPALSAEGFPFRDCWPWAEQLLTAFTPHRVMWGTDWTRTRGVSSYAQSLGWIADSGLLTGAELEAVMGLTAHRLFFRQ
jgi:predicted TIM-barrel fold metal-dependent hydrolase